MEKLISNDAKWEYALKFVLKHEGGFIANRNDPGGATNDGISLRWLEQAGIDVNLDGHIDLKDIEQITPENAAQIYKEYWWDKYKYYLIDNVFIAAKIFDLAVNMGAVEAHKLAQRAVNSFSCYPDILKKTLIIDGKLGDQTISNINAICTKGMSNQLLCNIKQQACAFYNNLVKEKPNLDVFLNGWLARVND